MDGLALSYEITDCVRMAFRPRNITTLQQGSHDLYMGAQTMGNTPEQFGGFVRAEIARWAKVVKASGARID